MKRERIGIRRLGQGLVCLIALLGAGGLAAQPLLPLHTADINNDGARNVADVNCYLEATIANVHGLVNPACQAFDDADVDMQCDGQINITDVQRSLLIVLWSLSGTTQLEQLLRAADLDFDLIHDNCDTDKDGDGYDDACEIAQGSDPLDPTSIPADPAACGGCPGGCIIDGQCYLAGAFAPGNNCLACDPAEDPSAFVPIENECDDNNACTVEDSCSEGVCQGLNITCNDGNVCTTDSCNPATGCVYANNSLPCNDGNACTSGDVCGGGVCGGTPIVCNDNNVCTNDSCNPASGCVFTNNTLPCNDSNACTSGDICAAGVCAGTPIVCNDSNVCTNDSCNPATGCVFANNTLPCDDGNACTTSDVCGGGTCAGAALTCSDGNVCTTDSCNPATGCVFTNNTLPCNDGNACTSGDVCGGGACAGTLITCNDNNICTNDSCNPASGCVFTNNSAPCNDGNACTQTDTCSGGSCVGGNPVVCPSNLHPDCNAGACNPATGLCSVPNGTPCDDGEACTVNDACVAGQCAADALPCNEAICLISGNAGDKVVCPVLVGRPSAADMPAVGIQFKLDYDVTKITLDYIDAGEFCIIPGVPDLCFPSTIPPSAQLTSGHGVNLVPTDLADWDLPGAAREALVINISAPTPLTNAVIDMDGNLVSGEPVLMGFVFTLDVDIPANAPAILDMTGIAATDEAAGFLQSVIKNFHVITFKP